MPRVFFVLMAVLVAYVRLFNGLLALFLLRLLFFIIAI